MRPRSSVVRRLSGALIGLITVWCLGCSGYDSLIDWLLGTHAGMVMACDQQPQGANAATIAPSTDDRGFDCGCGSCHAPSTQLSRLEQSRPNIAEIERLEPAAPESVTRAPLLPPPEFVA